MNNNENKNYLVLLDFINVLSFIIGIENLNMNDKQIQQLEEHLSKQDEQYNKILKLLEDKKSL